jgi:glycerophosphoryl diester phosphodiesterase
VVLAEIDRAHMRDRVVVQGFDWRALVAMKKLAPDIPTSCLTSRSRGFDTMTPGPEGRSPWHAGLALADHGGSVPALVKAAGCSIWSPLAANVTPEAVADAHARGLQVLPWTVDDPALMRKLIDQGVDGIITDYPDRLRSVMQATGVPLP